MKANEVLELVRAGFSKQEIAEMETNDAKQDPVQSDAPDASAETDVKQDPVQSEPAPAENKPDSGLKEFADTVKEMIASNKELMKVIQASNLQNDSHGSNSIDDINKQAEKILMGTIAPERKEGK